MRTLPYLALTSACAGMRSDLRMALGSLPKYLMILSSVKTHTGKPGQTTEILPVTVVLLVSDSIFCTNILDPNCLLLIVFGCACSD